MLLNVRPSRIALFGATGGTGGATLRALLANHEDPHIEIRLLVRSKSKLLAQYPQISSLSNVHMLEGQLDDTKIVKECIQGADTIVCALGENRNIPGIHVLQDLAGSIIQSLLELQTLSGNSWSQPRLILLSSSTWNDVLSAHTPAPMLWIIRTAFCHPYHDLRQATALFKARPELLSLKLVHPPAIVDDKASGMEISTERVRLTVSYEDLGAAFAQLIVMTESFEKNDAVGVSSQDGDNFRRYGFEIMKRIFIGIVSGFVPGYWRIFS